MRRLALLLILTLPSFGQVSIGPERVAFVSAFHGPVGGFGAIAVYEDQAGAPVAQPGWARQLRLLPIDFVGRTALDELAQDLPRYRADLASASRLVLQRGRGTLLRYERLVPVGRLFGYLRIRADGRPQRLIERPGTGAGQATDPFLARVAIDAAGESMLLATTPAAGGDLLEVSLISGAALNRTPDLPAQAFSHAGLWLAHDWGFGLSSAGIVRFDRSAGAVGSFVPMPTPAPAWFSGQAVMSPRRTFALTTAGSGPAGQLAFVFGPSGSARGASRVPADLSGAGFLPESLHGPYMAVSDDGALASWREVTANTPPTRELHLVRVVPDPDPVVVTGDNFFLDTLDEVGQVNASFDPSVMTLAVGERSADGTLEKADVFEVRLDAAGQPQFINRTLSSGDAVAPFKSPGTLSPEVARRLPGDGTLLIYDEDDDRLLALPPGQIGVTVLMSDVKELQVLERAGERWLFGLRRSSGQKPGELHVADLDLTGWTQLGAGGADVEFFDAVGHDDGQVLLRTVVGDTQHYVQRIDTLSGAVDSWQPTASSYQTPFGFTGGGSALFAQGPTGGPSALRVWPQLGPAFDLAGPAGAGHVLR